MKLLDLSQPIEDAGPNCPVHPPISSRRIADHPQDGWRMELLTLASHTGSHIDAPLHKLAGGATINDFPISAFVGPAIAVDLRHLGPDAPITAAELAKRISINLHDCIVLLATGWGDRRAKSEEWHSHSPFLAADGAQWLVDRKIRAVGIDHYSIGGSREPENSKTHEVLLGAKKWILEDIKIPEELFSVTTPFTLWALPINLANHSGAFCRPVAVIP